MLLAPAALIDLLAAALAVALLGLAAALLLVIVVLLASGPGVTAGLVAATSDPLRQLLRRQSGCVG
ncbi:MAG: hypothetical protein ACJ788_26170, partial [Ktedonobacteraceae bacterium]